jgi:diguanylate cyclase (GGDEF)-like protein
MRGSHNHAGYLRRFFALIFACLGFWSIASPASAAIKPQICVRTAEPGDAVADQFDLTNGFDCTIKQTDFGPGEYWARMRGFSAAPQQGEHLVVRFVSMWQESADVYFRYADGYLAKDSYSADKASEHLTIGAIFELDVPWREAPLTEIVVRVHESANVRGIVLGAEIETAKASYAKQAKWIALYAAFLGVALTLIVYNLALWRALGHRFQLYYCGMVASMLIYASSTSGAMIFAFPGIDNLTRLKLGYGFLAGTAAMALLFFRDFFEPTVITPRLRKLVNGAVALLVVSTASFALLSSFGGAPFGRIYYAGYLPGVFVIPMLLFYAWRRKSAYLGIFLLAWTPPLLAGALRWLHGIDLLPYNFWLDNSSIIAFACEALISSAAISMRVRVLSSERDHARNEEAMAHELARVDPLTGLLNRRGFLDAALGRDGHYQLALFDIDHFKKINDKYGHESGDDVLKAFAETLRLWSPEGALIARVGGEEFAVLTSERKVDRQAFDGLLHLVRSAPTAGLISVTTSIGISRGPLSNETDWQKLYRQADAALYRAKADGRDRYAVSTQFARAA